MCSVAVINTARPRDAYLQACSREIRYLEAMHSFDLRARHLPGAHNRISDSLSRWDVSSDYSRKFYHLTQNFIVTEEHINIDMFEFSHIW